MKTEPDAAFAAAVEALTGLDFDSTTEGTVRDLAARLDLLQRITTLARSYSDEITESLAARMDEDNMTITGVGIVTRKQRTSSAWIDDGARERLLDDTARALIEKVAVDPMTGEIHPPLANATREVWRLVQEAFSLGADPKAGFRKVLGLQPDLYRSKYPTGYTVTITEESL